MHRGLPSPYLTLILTLDEPLTMAKHLDPAAGPSNHDALLGGMHDRPVQVTHDGNQSGIQIGLEPLAVRALLGVPAGELWCLDLDPSDVFGSWVDGVRERLLAATDWPSRFAVVDDMLLRAERAALRPSCTCLRRGAARLATPADLRRTIPDRRPCPRDRLE